MLRFVLWSADIPSLAKPLRTAPIEPPLGPRSAAPYEVEEEHSKTSFCSLFLLSLYICYLTSSTSLLTLYSALLCLTTLVIPRIHPLISHWSNTNPANRILPQSSSLTLPWLALPSLTFFQIVDLSLILKDNAPSKTVNPDDEFADNLWDSEEQKAEQEEEDPFWK